LRTEQQEGAAEPPSALTFEVRLERVPTVFLDVFSTVFEPPVIDKIEAMIEPNTRLRGQLQVIDWDSQRDDLSCSTVRPSKYYRAVADLRPLGFEAMLHIDQKRYHTSKIELFETGKKGMAEIQNTIERIVDCDPAVLRMGRVDLAADVGAVSLPWFREHAYMQYKQFICAHAKVVEAEDSEMGKKIYQTLYFGRKPSCVRIYDKVAERVAHFELTKRKENYRAKKDYKEYRGQLPEGEPDLFVWPQHLRVAEWLAAELPLIDSAAWLVPQSSDRFPVLTRVENQFGGRVPPALHTIGEMRKNVLDFNPFEHMKLLQRGNVIPPSLFEKVTRPWGEEKYRFRVHEWMAYMWVLQNWKTVGAQQMWAMLNRDRHGKLYLENMKEFLPPVEDDSPGISAPELYERYRTSISRQLAA
jgi:hypothetical protein